MKNLKEAMAEIEEIMERYDCGGFVSLHNQARAEFKYFFEHMSWSNVRWVKDGEVMHLKLYSKSAKENTNATVGMLYDLRDQGGHMFMSLDKVAKQIEQSVKVEHVNFTQRLDDDKKRGDR